MVIEWRLKVLKPLSSPVYILRDGNVYSTSCVSAIFNAEKNITSQLIHHRADCQGVLIGSQGVISSGLGGGKKEGMGDRRMDGQKD